MEFPIRVSDVMSQPLRTTGPGTAAAEAANRCAREGIGSLVVVEDDALVGIVTNDDFVTLLGSAPDPKTTTVREFMSSPVVTVRSDAPVDAAVEKMFEEKIARLVVVENDVPVGLVSTDDVVRYVPQILHRRQMDPQYAEERRFRVTRETAYERDDWEFECTTADDETVSTGDRVTFSKTITDEDVRSFASASGDTNRLHLDDAFAAETRFGRRIVHGTLVSGLISAALARLPGLTIYLSQDLTFLAPVDVGDRVTAVCRVTDSFGRHKYELTTDVIGADDETVIEGEAAVLIDETPDASAVEFEAIAQG